MVLRNGRVSLDTEHVGYSYPSPHDSPRESRGVVQLVSVLESRRLRAERSHFFGGVTFPYASWGVTTGKISTVLAPPPLLNGFSVSYNVCFDLKLVLGRRV